MSGHGITQICIGLSFLLLVLGLGSVDGKSLTVCKDGCDFTSVKAAVEAANPGDTVEVESGIYKENVRINKSLALIGKDTGAGKPVIDAGGNDSAVIILADRVTLEGFNLTNALGSQADFYAGIRIWANDSIIKNNVAFYNENGILMTRSLNGTLKNNDLITNVYGLRIENSQNISASDNEMRDNLYGLLMESSDSNLLRSNVAEDNDFGIKLNDSKNNILIDNLMRNNSYNFGAEGHNEIGTDNLVDSRPVFYLLGAKDRVINSSTDAGTIYCLDCHNITIQGMNLSNSFHGIYLYNTTGSILENNNLRYCCVGVSLGDSNDNYMMRNLIKGCLVGGIDLMDSDYNKMNSNSLVENRNGLFLLRSGGNDIQDNLMMNGNTGANLDSSWRNTVSGNTISDNHYGIQLFSCVRNNISGNNITNNSVGIFHDALGNNTIDNLMLNNTNNETVSQKPTAGGLKPQKKVRIDSEPQGATVLIDGKPIEKTTPYDAVFTKAGSYKLELRSGNKRAEQTIIIPEGKKPEPIPIVTLK